MRIATLLTAALLLVFGNVPDVSAQKKKEFSIPKPYRALEVRPSAELQKLLDAAVRETLAEYSAKGVKAENVAATVIDMRDPTSFATAEFRGESQIYPASVPKMFYMAALEQWIADGRVKATGEIDRALRDMVVDSSNDATQYIVDVLSGVASGPELPEKQFRDWAFKRNVVNRYFTALGYKNININQKIYCEDAYGVEQQFRNYRGENRNRLTTNATARLLAEIVLGRMGDKAVTDRMTALLKREPFKKSEDINDQSHGFTGIALIERNLVGARLWSKAGWTSKTRHDAAYIELPDGRKLVIVVFTELFSGERNLIPAIAGRVIDGLPK